MDVNLWAHWLVKLRMHVRPLVSLAFISLALVSCSQGKSAERRDFDTATVRRQDIEITASATGVLQPRRVVEVKSKASGEIVDLPVETGDYVRAGTVLARLYPRDAQNQFAQARAEVEAAKARLATSESELRRAAALREAQLLPETDYESRRLEVINAQAQLVGRQTSMDIASERLRETTVIAPVSGRIIEKSVELGNVVSSAVSQVSGGTTMMKMADLREVEIRALVDETDIGKVRPGQEVRIKVDAFPGQTFRGTIEKIEPQAIVDQNVTMFPVLVRIPNEQEILRPGMNAEVDIFIAQYEDVLAVPNEAIRTPRDAFGAAAAVGLTAEQMQQALGGGERRGGEREGATAGRGGPPNPQGGERAVRPAGDGARSGGTGGSERRRPPQGAAGGADPTRNLAPHGAESSPGIVFKLVGDKVEPARVMLGVSNWDYTQVVSGLNPGDTVIVLPSSGLLRQQEEFRARMRGMTGMPGMGGSGGRAPGAGGRGRG